mmetsp:Transcript_11826/g.55002  ORF Transcript_11826/g.55002 Transcript_11826/m.55002 type:complete len:222 (-) Transcript_11826:2864-3529(-)
MLPPAAAGTRGPAEFTSAVVSAEKIIDSLSKLPPLEGGVIKAEGVTVPSVVSTTSVIAKSAETTSLNSDSVPSESEASDAATPPRVGCDPILVASEDSGVPATVSCVPSGCGVSSSPAPSSSGSVAAAATTGGCSSSSSASSIVSSSSAPTGGSSAAAAAPTGGCSSAAAAAAVAYCDQAAAYCDQRVAVAIAICDWASAPAACCELAARAAACCDPVPVA